MEPTASPLEPTYRRRRRKKQRSLGRHLSRIAARLFGAAVFCASIYGAAKLGIYSAKQRLPQAEVTAAPLERETISLGQNGAPVFLASEPDSLRRFFSQFPRPADRAIANTSSFGIRRLTGNFSAEITERDGDAIKLLVTSGSIAGTTYWIHHSQLHDTSAGANNDRGIAPLPGDILSPQPQ